MADIILVNINPAYQEHELEYCLQKGNNIFKKNDKPQNTKFFQWILEKNEENKAVHPFLDCLWAIQLKYYQLKFKDIS